MCEQSAGNYEHRENNNGLKVFCSYQVRAIGRFAFLKGDVSLRDVKGAPVAVNKKRTMC